METIDSLKPNDEVTIKIWGPDERCIYQSTNSGYHSLESAIRENLGRANLEVNPEDCVFEVDNKTKSVIHRYRLNAHGHLKLILEN